MLGGRVKTLHPRIHAAILARRDHPDDLAALDDHGIEPIDLVCVGFYPFTQIASRHGVTEADAVEMIDIGGPSMLRAAAKNFAHVVPVCSPKRYPEILEELRERRGGSPRTPGGDSRPRPSRRPRRTRRRSRPGSWDARRFPTGSSPASRRPRTSRTGRTRTSARRTTWRTGRRRHLLSRVDQLHGKQLSFNNLNDLSAARRLLGEFQLPACVVVKHANPCGVAVSRSIEDAFAKRTTRIRSRPTGWCSRSTGR